MLLQARSASDQDLASGEEWFTLALSPDLLRCSTTTSYRNSPLRSRLPDHVKSLTSSESNCQIHSSTTHFRTPSSLRVESTNISLIASFRNTSPAGTEQAVRMTSLANSAHCSHLPRRQHSSICPRIPPSSALAPLRMTVSRYAQPVKTSKAQDCGASENSKTVFRCEAAKISRTRSQKCRGRLFSRFRSACSRTC